MTTIYLLRIRFYFVCFADKRTTHWDGSQCLIASGQSGTGSLPSLYDW